MTGDGLVWEINGVAPKILERYLKALSEFRPREYKVVIIDNAAFHSTKNIEVPEDIYVLNIPAHSPELDPCERIWRYIQKRYRNRTLEDMQALRRWPWDMDGDLVRSIVGNKRYKEIIYGNSL